MRKNFIMKKDARILKNEFTAIYRPGPAAWVAGPLRIG